MKVDKLTSEQEQALLELRQEWLEIGLCTDRSDRKRATDAVTAIWKQHLPDKEVPPVFFWDGPLFAHVGMNIISGIIPLSENVEHNLGANLRDNLRVNLGANLGANLLGS